MFLLDVVAIRHQELHCANCQHRAGWNVETLEILHLILLEQVEDITVRHVTVLTCLEMLDVQGGGEEEQRKEAAKEEQKDGQKFGAGRNTRRHKSRLVK